MMNKSPKTCHVLHRTKLAGALNGKKVYLSGPIEHQAEKLSEENITIALAPDLTIDTGIPSKKEAVILTKKKLNWRPVVINTLKKHFGLDVFDPYADPKQQWAPELLRAREERNFLKMAEIAEKFVQKDLGKVDRSDFLVVNLPYQVPTTGTHHEIIMASNLKKPTLLVCEQGREHLPLWYYGFISLEFMFDSWDDMYSYLDEVDRGLHIQNRKWAYVYGII